MFDRFSHDNIFKIKLPCQTLFKHEHRRHKLVYFNFGKAYYFVLRVKQHNFNKARFFKMNKVSPAIVN